MTLQNARKACSALLPAFAHSALNRCNLPSIILGAGAYQQQPIALFIDGVAELHQDFFHALRLINTADERALHFSQYMRSAFLLGKSEEAGFNPKSTGVQRDKADYRRLLRGWMFNPDGIEAAVMKRWVESRFGLLALNHKGLLHDTSSAAYATYQADYVRGLYNSNALESQLDLLYSYCQYELQRQWPEQSHYLLYRAINHINEHHQISDDDSAQRALLLNNLNSFSNNLELIESFGDVLLQVNVPASKLLYFPELLPGTLKGEGEYLVIGGVYQTRTMT